MDYVDFLWYNYYTNCSSSYSTSLDLSCTNGYWISISRLCCLEGELGMKLTQEVIDQIQEAMLHTKMNGDVNWQDGDEIDVCLGGTFAGDKFISIINRTRSNTTKR